MKGFGICIDSGIGGYDVNIFSFQNTLRSDLTNGVRETLNVAPITTTLPGDSHHMRYNHACTLNVLNSEHIYLYIWIKGNELRVYASTAYVSNFLCFGTYIPSDSSQPSVANYTIFGNHILLTSKSNLGGASFSVPSIRTMIPNESTTGINMVKSLATLRQTSYWTPSHVLTVATVAVNFILLVHYISEYNTHLGMVQSRVHHQAIYNMYNTYVVFHAVAHACITVVDLFFVSTVLFIINAPLFFVRVIQALTRTLQLSVDTTTSTHVTTRTSPLLQKLSYVPGVTAVLTLSPEFRYILADTTYFISFCYSLLCLLA
uniref:Putative helicase helY n=1 Tax=Lygus hesperus TaxID=30085 RepID=A0A0A9XI92_LYGHE